jgi:hypothetical protein
MSVFEVPYATVDEPRRTARCSAPEVISLDERGTESSHCGVARDAGPRDTAPDYEKVELLGAEPAEAAGSGGRGPNARRPAPHQGVTRELRRFAHR